VPAETSTPTLTRGRDLHQGRRALGTGVGGIRSPPTNTVGRRTHSVSSEKEPPPMTRQPGKSAAFAAAGRILSRPSMRPVTRTFSNLHAALYRLTRGSAQNRKYPTMLLTVTGRRSGKAHTVPLIYIKDGERLVIAAAYAGSDTDPSWWRNLRAHPRAVAQGEPRHLHRRGRTCQGRRTPGSMAAPCRDVSLLHRLPAAHQPRASRRRAYTAPRINIRLPRSRQPSRVVLASSTSADSMSLASLSGTSGQ